jgi:hypothetical protein
MTSITIMVTATVITSCVAVAHRVIVGLAGAGPRRAQVQPAKLYSTSAATDTPALIGFATGAGRGAPRFRMRSLCPPQESQVHNGRREGQVLSKLGSRATFDTAIPAHC